MNITKDSRKIWTWWDTGVDTFNTVQHKCIDSWKRLNPDWEIIVLDANNLSDYISAKEWVYETIPVIQGTDYFLRDQAFSDVVKVMILEKYGGVYMDSDVFCNKPLDEWLVSASDFFTFRVNDINTDFNDERIGLPRLIDIWLTAVSHPKHYMLSKWLENMAYYLNQLHCEGDLVLSPDRPTKLVTPRYFWAFFCFTGMIYSDEKFADLWKRTLNIDHKQTLWFRHNIHLNPVKLPTEIPVVYKLNRRLELEYKELFDVIV